MIDFSIDGLLKRNKKKEIKNDTAEEKNEAIRTELERTIDSLKEMSLEKDESIEFYKKTSENDKMTIMAYEIVLDNCASQDFKSNFDIEKLDSDWRVVTEYCGMGGCTRNGYLFNNELEARHKAI